MKYNKKYRRFNVLSSAESFMHRISSYPVVKDCKINRYKGGYRLKYKLQKGYHTVADYEETISHDQN